MENTNEKAQILSACKDEIAQRYGADGWQGIHLDFMFQIGESKITYDDLYGMACEMYAGQFKYHIAELEAKCQRYEEALQAIYDEGNGDIYDVDNDQSRYVYNVDQLAGKALGYID